MFSAHVRLAEMGAERDGGLIFAKRRMLIALKRVHIAAAKMRKCICRVVEGGLVVLGRGGLVLAECEINSTEELMHRVEA